LIFLPIHGSRIFPFGPFFAPLGIVCVFSQGGLLRVEKELKVLAALAREPDLANSVLPMEVFVQALRTGVLRLHVAQSDLIGGETINDEGTLGLGQMMEDAQN
jgi:hypothetical protein